MDKFIEWHRARVLRRTGREPAPSTLRSLRIRLRTAMRAADVTELSVLCNICTDPDRGEVLLDKLALTNQPGSCRLVYEACKSLHPYGVAQGWVNGDFALAAPGRSPAKPVTVYTSDEVETLISTARMKSLRWWMFLATIAHTGRRVSEVLGLRWDCLHLDANVPHFDLPHTKNKRQAYVPLDTFLVEQVFTEKNIEKLKVEDGKFGRPVSEFPFPWSYTTVEKMLRRHCDRVSIEPRGFHCFRHTKATELLARGVPIQAVSALLGHASVATTDSIYNHATALNYRDYLE